MAWATPSIFKHSVYPSDVIIRPINALKAFSRLDNELLSKQPCRAISACRLIWSHKGLMPRGTREGAPSNWWSQDLASHAFRGQRCRIQQIPTTVFYFCSGCKFLFFARCQSARLLQQRPRMYQIPHPSHSGPWDSLSNGTGCPKEEGFQEKDFLGLSWGNFKIHFQLQCSLFPVVFLVMSHQRTVWPWASY